MVVSEGENEGKNGENKEIEQIYPNMKKKWKDSLKHEMINWNLEKAKSKRIVKKKTHVESEFHFFRDMEF